MKMTASIFGGFGIFLILIIFQDFQRAGTIALIANAVSLVLGIFVGAAMGTLAEIGSVIGRRRSERPVVIMLAGLLGFFTPYVLFSVFIIPTIEKLNLPPTYDIGRPMMSFIISLILSAALALAFSHSFVKVRWMQGGEKC